MIYHFKTPNSPNNIYHLGVMGEFGPIVLHEHIVLVVSEVVLAGAEAELDHVAAGVVLVLPHVTVLPHLQQLPVIVVGEPKYFLTY